MKQAKVIVKTFPEAVKGDQANGNGQCWDFSLGTRIKKSG